MAIIASASGGSTQNTFELCPAGGQQAVCCDVIDLGMQKDTFRGTSRLVHKIRIRWQSQHPMKDGRPYMVQKRYTLSLAERATLRKDLEQWRGAMFEPAQLAGFDVEVLIGINAFINVMHIRKPKGTYAEVMNLMPVPSSTPKLTVRDYVRLKDRPAGQQAEREPGDQDEIAPELPAEPAPPVEEKPPF